MVIAQTLLRNIYNYDHLVFRHSRQLIEQVALPRYIRISATVQVLVETMVHYIHSQYENIRMHYEDSKGTFIVFIKGKFDEAATLDKLQENVREFKEFTVKFVQKGMIIRVDRESLMENYETFSKKLLEVFKEVRHKGNEKITEAKTQSWNLYEETLKKIREKEKQIKIQYKMIKEDSEQ